MKIIVAIDSLKGSLTSLEAGAAAREGILSASPASEVKIFCHKKTSLSEKHFIKKIFFAQAASNLSFNGRCCLALIITCCKNSCTAERIFKRRGEYKRHGG